MPDKLDFKQIALQIDIEAVADFLNLKIKHGADVRTSCPVCEGDRSIQLYPETNSFCCHKSHTAGDCIALYAHAKGYVGMYRAAKELSEHFLARGPITAPQKPAGRSQPVAKKAEAAFDPASFAAKLVFTDEVEALGLSQADAQRLGIGFYRGRTYFPMKDDTGFICGFVGYSTEGLKMPPKWLQQSNVVKLKRA